MLFSSDNLLVNLFLFCVGLYALLKGSDLFVDSASALAKRLKVSELVIGLTVVSMGTSLPELATNVYASLQGKDTIAYGNIVGSNITNVMLVLGLGTILLGQIDFPRKLFFRDGLTMLLMTLLTLGSAWFLHGLPRWGGAIYLLLFAVYMFILFRNQELPDGDDAPATFAGRGLAFLLLILALGLTLVTGGAKAVVDNAIWLATRLGVSETVVAVTAVALGTSLPELVVTITGIIKKRSGIAIGNIVGSNIFNMQLILGVSSLIHPLRVETTMRNFNLPWLLVSDLLLLTFMRTKWKLLRWEGVILFLGYAIFLWKNFAG
ncbi:MAG: calcium/sodium antiporter [Victivallales bacterium]|nr:calcium/sodium antiporter [Victivallales bacterium]